jgi:hypothetical protein
MPFTFFWSLYNEIIFLNYAAIWLDCTCSNAIIYSRLRRLEN